jgi:hypothetical protein
VLHTPLPDGAELQLIYKRWRRQSGALISPLFFKVLLSRENMPSHIWSVELAQMVVGSSSLIFDVSPASADGSDMSQFLVAAWAIHPDLIPNEVGYAEPEPVKPFIEWQPPLFLQASELIHSKCDTLGFWALIKILEINDFSPAEDSSDDSSDSNGLSGADGLPGLGGGSSLRPWSTMYRFTDGSSPTVVPWLILPRHGGDVQWGPPEIA